MKQTLRFDQISCRLQVEGLPDVSIGQGGEAIGIITGWTLQWTGRPELEGKKEHLLALMQAVLPYARRLVSGAPQPRSSDSGQVHITPVAPRGHRLELLSSQPDTPPLQLQLDDAELTDLVRVLDQLRLDPRLQLELALPPERPLRSRELSSRIPRRQRLAAPAAAVALLAISATASWLWPTPRPLSPLPQTATNPGKVKPAR